jgi:hypothetical protein
MSLSSAEAPLLDRRAEMCAGCRSGRVPLAWLGVHLDGDRRGGLAQPIGDRVGHRPDPDVNDPPILATLGMKLAHLVDLSTSYPARYRVRSTLSIKIRGRPAALVILADRAAPLAVRTHPTDRAADGPANQRVSVDGTSWHRLAVQRCNIACRREMNSSTEATDSTSGSVSS